MSETKEFEGKTYRKVWDDAEKWSCHPKCCFYFEEDGCIACDAPEDGDFTGCSDGFHWEEVTGVKIDPKDTYEFCPDTCNHYDCQHKKGTGCKKTMIRINRNGECVDFQKKEGEK